MLTLTLGESGSVRAETLGTIQLSFVKGGEGTRQGVKSNPFVCRRSGGWWWWWGERGGGGHDGVLAPCQRVSIASVMERPAEDDGLAETSPGTCFLLPFTCRPLPPAPPHGLPSYKHLLCRLNGAGCTPLTLISISHCPPIDGEGDSICACLAWCHPFNRHMLRM